MEKPQSFWQARLCATCSDTEGNKNLMDIQRYVSPDLTHLVGRGRKPHREQYRLLKKILREGTLRAPRAKRIKNEGSVIGIDKVYWLERRSAARLSDNGAYRGSFVCFCDIPLSDLGLHIWKYGCFGLAFSKTFLLEHGATPVMYVPTRGRPAVLPWGNYGRKRVSSNAASFDAFWKHYKELCDVVEKEHGGNRVPQSIRRVTQFMDMHVLSHLKFFDPSVADWHKANFYMEREWRISGDVAFGLRDVRRVIVTEGYAQKFRRDFPKYSGEVIMAD